MASRGFSQSCQMKSRNQAAGFSELSPGDIAPMIKWISGCNLPGKFIWGDFKKISGQLHEASIGCFLNSADCMFAQAR